MLCACSSHGSVRLLLAGLAAVLLVLAAPARSRAEGPDAIQYLAGCSDSQLARNDDGSTGRVGLGFTLDFLGTTYDGVYVNNNGNVTFDSPLSTYTPFPLSATSRVIVAPFSATSTRAPRPRTSSPSARP